MEQLPYYAVLTIIIIHWFADFVLQTHEQAVNKSTSFEHLLGHTTVYSACWFTPMVVLFCQDTNFLVAVWAALLFIVITFLTHTLTDYYTSKINARLWKEKRVHDFFVTVGFDQVLHYIQLFATYKVLTLLF